MAQIHAKLATQFHAHKDRQSRRGRIAPTLLPWELRAERFSRCCSAADFPSSDVLFILFISDNAILGPDDAHRGLFMLSYSGSSSESGDGRTDAKSVSRSEATRKPDSTRKKAWASRSRTGCRTCRARRVRCDEEHPKCRRCIKGGHECRGYELPALEENGLVISASLSPEALREQHAAGKKLWTALSRRPERLTLEIDPPHWDYMQAVRFYHTCVREWRPKQFGVVQAPTFNDDTHPANFVGRQLAHYIKIMSLQRGQLLLPGVGQPGLESLWSGYAAAMLQLIELVNFFIRGGTFNGRNYIYSCLYTLMRLDLPAHWSLWHAHIRGSIAYIASIGGVTAMLESGRRYGPPIGFTRLLSEAIMFSTTTPARMQITDYYHFTDHEMRTILLGEYDCDLPAPMDLRIAIFHINRLRYQAATIANPASLTPAVHRLLDEIEAADVDAWSARNPVYGPTHSLALSRIFRVAVSLFALLTLPRPATTAWIRRRGVPYPNACVGLRTELLARMRALFPHLEYQPNLRWPMVVVGVALANGGREEDKEFVSRSLLAIWEQPVVACGPMRCRELLQRLWASGKTEWEQCFVEPVPC